MSDNTGAAASQAAQGSGQQPLSKSARRRQAAKRRAAEEKGNNQGNGQGNKQENQEKPKQAAPAEQKQASNAPNNNKNEDGNKNKNKRNKNKKPKEAQGQAPAPAQAATFTGALPAHGIAGSQHERTFIAIKPDGVQRGKIGAILARFENKGFKLVALKLLTPTKEMAAQHYSDLSKKPFFNGLCEYFSSGPIIAMVWEGLNSIKTGRLLLGETNPAQSLPGTIRGDFCIEVGRNICHGSDGPEGAQKEINYWFNANEISNWNPADTQWVYEKPKLSAREEKTELTGKHHHAKGKLPPAGNAGTNTERTFIAIKPDGVQRGKIGAILARFEEKGFKLVALKMLMPTKEMAAQHYSDLSKKPFFNGLCEYFSSGPIVAMVWEGLNSIKTGRLLLGETDPAKSLPGTIRGDFCIEVGRNICHGSDGPEGAAKEIGFWFHPTEISEWAPASIKWVYEKP